MAEPTRVECRACTEPATHLLYRTNPEEHSRQTMEACKLHHELACDYKAPRVQGRESPADQSKKDRWLDEARKLEAPGLAEVFLSPDRDGQFHSRRLNPREREIAQNELRREQRSYEL